jgi:uncharacterized protein YkwD
MKFSFVLVAALPVAIGYCNISLAASVSLSASSLSVTGCSYNGQTGDGAVALYCAGDIHGSVAFPTGDGTYQISIVARADLVPGRFPNVEISIDGSVVGNISVTTSNFSPFTLDNVSASAGSHTLRITFTNDYYSAGQDLNLYVQSITVTPNSGNPGPAPSAATSPDAYQKLLLDLINASRAGSGLTPLTFSPEQSSGDASCVGSYGHSVHMQQVGTISHDQFPQDICIPWSAAGENVGYSSGSVNQAIQILHRQMINEGPAGGHYQNIMSRSFTTLGIGLYYNNGTLWLTEDFVR